jgi:predicted SAM-dependent methyltransferase
VGCGGGGVIATALRLNFACGGSRWDGFDNSDTNQEPGTTYVDLAQPPYPYEDGSAELILISHALFMGSNGSLQHPDLRPIMAEFHRILEPAGWLRIDDNPFRCFDPDEQLDVQQAHEESTRGFKDEWKLPRADLVSVLEDCGFTVHNIVGRVAEAFPDAVAAIVGNQMGHYSFSLEAQK